MDNKRTFFVWLILLLSVLSSMFISQAKSQPQPQPQTHAQITSRATPLVSAEWLQANISRDDVIVIDASSPQRFEVKHIPNAIKANVFMLGSRDVTAAHMEQLVRSWGMNPGTKIVLYDEGATYMASSLFFELYYHGFNMENIFILNGGLARWEANGGAVTKAPTPQPTIGTIAHAGLREGARARHAEFVSASGAPQKSVLVEGLDPEYYYGGAKFFSQAGHVPHAVLMPSDDFFNADKTFKSLIEIERMFSHIGITPNRQVITYCGGGVAASLSYFTAKFLLGYPDVKLYKGSQREWLRDDRGLPFWTFAEPNRLRDPQWVNGWNSDMMRMMEASQLNIIDSRAADIRARGTIPHSLAIPAANLKPHISSPQKLADVFGKAGLVQEHEAVILSDGGITPDAALTMLLLENLGHAKVSIIHGAIDDWALAGLPTAKTSAAPTVRVQQYAARPRNDVLITPDKVTKPTTTPRIILVAGKLNAMAKPAGNVIEMPYTDFIDKNGKPKPANDIWKLLVNAGVSRYAEIICVADELGEAAVSYVVLKMMGYADVKVMQAS
jgi:thiosulfate/3-mercaptopyruvate sulfurtransferase